MDMYNFMMNLEEMYEQCKTEEEIDAMTEKIIKYAKSKSVVSKQYLKMGIL